MSPNAAMLGIYWGILFVLEVGFCLVLLLARKDVTKVRFCFCSSSADGREEIPGIWGEGTRLGGGEAAAGDGGSRQEEEMPRAEVKARERQSMRGATTDKVGDLDSWSWGALCCGQLATGRLGCVFCEWLSSEYGDISLRLE